MSVGFDPTADFADITDGLEAVTLLRRGVSVTVTVSCALRRALSTNELGASDGKYVSGDIRWHLPVEEVAAAPDLGDVILDNANERWVILEWAKQTLGARWRCVARSLRIANGLDNTVTIEKATIAKGTAGAIERTWTVHRTGIRARVQEMSATTAVEQGAMRTAKRYRIFLESDESLDHTHRIKDREGNYYQIDGTSGVAEIGQCMAVEATQWL
jgi:hypothetical protein